MTSFWILLLVRLKSPNCLETNYIRKKIFPRLLSLFWFFPLAHIITCLLDLITVTPLLIKSV